MLYQYIRWIIVKMDLIMSSIKVNTYVEIKPEYYVGEIGLTITCKASEKWKADLIIEMLETIEGIDITGTDYE